MKLSKFIIKRSINGFIGFVLIIFMYSTVFNTQLDVTAQAQIHGMVMGAMMSDAVRALPPEEIPVYKKQLQASLEKYFCLDKPIGQRIIWRTYNAVTFNFGEAQFLSTTKTFQKPKVSSKVIDIILENLPATLILFVTTTFICIIISIFLGIKKAQHSNTFLDRSTSLLTMVFAGTPPWWLGSFFILFFVYYLKILPFGSLNSSPPPEGAIAFFFDRILHMSIPVISVVLVRFWGSAYLIKYLITEPLQQDYIAAARGRGIPEKKILFGHALRVASPGILTMSILSLISSVGGDIILEIALAWPGIGLLLWHAIEWNDVPVMMGILTIITLIYCVSLLLLDIIYAFLDPRIQY